MKGDYLDLWVSEGDLALDVVDIPLTVDQRDSIAQDIKHMIIETGLMVQLVAERNPERRALSVQRIERRVDLDIRIVPGSARVTPMELESYFISATTVDYGPLSLELTAGT